MFKIDERKKEGERFCFRPGKREESVCFQLTANPIQHVGIDCAPLPFVQDLMAHVGEDLQVAGTGHGASHQLVRRLHSIGLATSYGIVFAADEQNGKVRGIVFRRLPLNGPGSQSG